MVGHPNVPQAQVSNLHHSSPDDSRFMRNLIHQLIYPRLSDRYHPLRNENTHNTGRSGQPTNKLLQYD